MSDVSKLKFENGSYNIKDTVARNEIHTLDQKIESNTTQLESEINNLDLQLEQKAPKSNIVYMTDFKREENETNDDGRFERAIASLPTSGGLVFLEGVTYNITKPILLSWYQGLEGVYGATVIQKTGNATRPEHLYDSIVGVIEEDGNSIYGVNISNLTLKGSFNEYGIKLSYASHTRIDNVFIEEVQNGIHATNNWLASYRNVIIRNRQASGVLGVKIEGGTSNHFDRCWVKKFNAGYDMGATMYSVFNGCAVDTFTNFAYYGGQAVVYNGCGAEDATLTNGGFIYGGGARTVTLNNCQSLEIGTDQTIAGNASMFYFEGSRAIINGYRLNYFRNDEVIDIVKTKNDAVVNIKNSQFPSNRNKWANIDSQWGKVVIESGDTKQYFFQDENKNFTTSANDYVNGLRKGAGIEVLGDYTNKIPFRAYSNLYKNTHKTQTGTTPILKIDSQTSGKSTVSLHFKVYVNKNDGSSCLLEGMAVILNGAKQPITLTERYGTAYDFVLAWNGDTLEATLNEPYSNAFIETTVTQNISTGFQNFVWL